MQTADQGWLVAGGLRRPRVRRPRVRPAAPSYWCRIQVNEGKPSQATRVIPAERLLQERMKPLAPSPKYGHALSPPGRAGLSSSSGSVRITTYSAHSEDLQERAACRIAARSPTRGSGTTSCSSGFVSQDHLREASAGGFPPVSGSALVPSGLVSKGSSPHGYSGKPLMVFRFRSLRVQEGIPVAYPRPRASRERTAPARPGREQ
jgi:hypothetical protein